MSTSFGCHCDERKKPPNLRRWVVLQRKCNHSAFNGWHWTPSEWSEVACCVCLGVGRTRAKYVDQLKDDRGDWDRALYGER